MLTGVAHRNDADGGAMLNENKLQKVELTLLVIVVVVVAIGYVVSWFQQ